MEKFLYSIYDKKLQRYNIPGFDDDDNTIRIGLSRELKNKTSFLYVNRDDLALYKLGVFDDKTGHVDRLSEPELVCDISNLTED